MKKAPKADDRVESEFKLCVPVPGLEGAVSGVRVQDGHESLGMLVPVPEGTPVPPGIELVISERVDGSTLKLTTVYKAKGPARVATPRYRSNYDAVFKPKPKPTDKSWN